MTVTVASLQAMVTDATEADVLAAVADYSARNSLHLYAEISRNSGNDKAYDLPGDFLFLVKLVETGLSGYYIAAGLMMFTVKPDSETLHIWYGAKHVANESDEFENLADDEAHIIALKLQAIVLRNTPIEGGGLRYRQGDVEVDTKGMADSRGKELATLEDEYLRAIKARIGTVGLRSEYPDYVGPTTF